MTVRPPSNARRETDNPLHGMLDHEIAGEMASALGRAGRKVEKAVKALREAGPDDPQRAKLLELASEAVYAYLVQREICGFRRHEGVIREYAIPREVLARLGAS